ncbi:MAG TPA: response regulator [Noviherbaspirillum sp.]|jgi:CheY-like chemotaxis protein|uniref:response regulator n=1 Tax=Noviherbaspirillum sp. TaxID=1926288 RepID=UPI002DDCA3CF|nr:response regulator [Noviherbaspirillum sp.]HEV2609957.1 response regulator [Noviherbaspirillum sp.]
MTNHLLLIEDDEIAVYLTLKMLRASGFSAEIDVVHDGMEAIAYLTCHGLYENRLSGNPSLILLDLKLPDLDGFEVLKQIRTNPVLSTIPVFILSASNTDEDMYRSNLLGISKYLIKPLDVIEFRQEAAKVLSFTTPSLH